MKPKHVGALALIIFGSYFLTRNLNILPRADLIWPLILIALGGIALYQSSQSRIGTTRSSNSSDEVIWEVNGSSPLFKGLIAIPVLLIVSFTGLIMLGILGPFFLLFLLFIPIMLFFKLGWAFLRLMIPIIFAATPLLLLIWIVSLLF